MKKLTNGNTWDNEYTDKLNELIDLVNSQQEAIEKLESKVWTADFIEKYRPALESLAKPDTHRTVTLRIPKGMRVGDAFNLAYLFSDSSWEEFITRSDTDLQKALDEVEGESCE